MKISFILGDELEKSEILFIKLINPINNEELVKDSKEYIDEKGYLYYMKNNTQYFIIKPIIYKDHLDYHETFLTKKDDINRLIKYLGIKELVLDGNELIDLNINNIEDIKESFKETQFKNDISKNIMYLKDYTV